MPYGSTIIHLSRPLEMGTPFLYSVSSLLLFIYLFFCYNKQMSMICVYLLDSTHNYSYPCSLLIFTPCVISFHPFVLSLCVFLKLK